MKVRKKRFAYARMMDVKMSKRFARQRQTKMVWRWNYVFVLKKSVVKRRKFVKSQQMKTESKRRFVNASKKNVNKEKLRFVLNKSKIMMRL